MRRQVYLSVLATALAIGVAATGSWAGSGCGGQSKAGQGCGGGCEGGGGGCSGGGGCAKGCGSGSMADARDTFHALLGDHEKVQRTVVAIEGGVATTTTSEDLAVAANIRKHVRQMQGRVASGDGLRYWDPLFVEVFKHHDEIVMVIEDVPGGVSVKETSANPDVVKLIRAHAQTVSEFAARGFDRAHEESAIPEGHPSSGSNAAN